MSQTRRDNLKQAYAVDGLGCAVKPVVTLLLQLLCHPTSASVLSVGPDKSYTEIQDVPWESLAAGDIVEIHWRPTPYLSKWVIARSGTTTQPITVRGIKNASGDRPIVSGNNAITRTQLNYWNEDRGVIKIGGSSIPAGAGRHIIIESLQIESAHPDYSFTDDSGNAGTYRGNAASIFIEHGEYIVIRDCVLTDSGNGIFVANLSSDITVEHSHLYGNGNSGSIFEHNAYTEALGMVYQFNRFGALRSGSGGNNLKDRSAGLVVRYNWIEDGNRQLDLVDSATFAQSNPNEYQTTIVYGNVLIEHDGQGNRQMVHYGGDSGNTNNYRKGTLHFYHNTLVSERSGRSTLFRLGTNDESADVRNNVFFNAGGPNTLELATTAGQYSFSNNWLRADYVTSFDSGFIGTVNHAATITGTDPGFTDRLQQNYRPVDSSPLIDQATTLDSSVVDSYPMTQEYEMHLRAIARDEMNRDIGALSLKIAVPVEDIPALSFIAIAGLGSILALVGFAATRKR